MFIILFDFTQQFYEFKGMDINIPILHEIKGKEGG